MYIAGQDTSNSDRVGVLSECGEDSIKGRFNNRVAAWLDKQGEVFSLRETVGGRVEATVSSPAAGGQQDCLFIFQCKTDL